MTMPAMIAPGRRRERFDWSAIVEAAFIVAGFVLLTRAPNVAGDYWLQTAFRVLIYLTLAEAWNLMAGFTGLVSLGTSSFVGLGAYVAFGLRNHGDVSIPLVLAVAAASGAALAAIFSPALFRLRGLYFTVGTLALAELLRLTMINLSTFGGATGLVLQEDPPSLAILFEYALVLATIASVLIWICANSRFSVILRSVRDDEDAAMQMGVRPFRVKLAAFTLASALAAAAGAVQGIKLGAIEPYGMFGLQWSIDVLSIVVIGGAGFRLGPLIGTLFVVALGEWLADYPEAHIAITGIILIVTVRFAPQGIAGLLNRMIKPLAPSQSKATT